MKYLGIIFSRSRQTSLYGKHSTRVIERAETTVNLIRHMGFQKDGLRPETSVRMYKAMVRPILEYGAQVLSYKHHYFVDREIEKLEAPTEIIMKLEKFQNKVLKKLIPCQKNTPPEVIRLHANSSEDRCVKTKILLETAQRRGKNSPPDLPRTKRELSQRKRRIHS